VAVPPIDPTHTTPLMKAAIRFVRSGPGRWFGINIASRVDPPLLRLSRGRFSTFAMAPVVNLTVPGRKSGEPRSCALLYFTRGTDVVVVASSFGREKHPAWYHNIKAHPEVTLSAKGREARYVAREATGEERDRLFAVANQLYPGYADYEVRAGAVGRKIPVMVLSPA
jgi:deazaflavin-dependent oxidoreductase (nitroreductase family)